MNPIAPTAVAALVWRDRPLAELLRLSWPGVLSLLSVSTLTLVDSLFVGHLGSVQLAASGLGGVCVFAVLSFGLAVFGAAKVEVGLQYGAKNSEALKQSLGAFLALALLLGVASTLVGQLVSLLLPFLSADRPTGSFAGQYASLRAVGFPFSLLSAAVGGWLHAQGDSKSGMRAALIANVVNVPLNYLFIFVLHWGLKGAAVSTVLSCFLEAGWLILRRTQRFGAHSLRQETIPPGLHLDRAKLSIAYRALRLGLPSGLERVLDMMAFAAVPLLLSQVGPLHVAAHQIVLQIMLFSFLPLIAFNESVSVLIAQAVGAQSPGLARVLARLGMYCSLGYGIFCAGFCVILAQPLVSAFTHDRALVELSAATLLIAAFLQFVNAAYNLLKGVLRGLSAFRLVAWVTVGCAWVITPPLTYLVGVRWELGVQGAWGVLCLEVAIGTAIMWVHAQRRLSQLDGATLNLIAGSHATEP